MPEQTILVTGAGGFVGRALVRRLGSCQSLSLGGAGWLQAIRQASLRGQVVVHLAAQTERAAGQQQILQANVDKTAELARVAAERGATRFVFLSTAKVHGEESASLPFHAASPAAPPDEYSRSKWLAEEALRDIASDAGMPWVVLRAPLVFGREARGNFRALVRLVDSPLWLPFGAVRNRRSLIHVSDLAEALAVATRHPLAPGRVFMAAHPEPVSTPQLIQALRGRLGRPTRLLNLDPRLLERLALLGGVGAKTRRLLRSLEVDPYPLVRELGWAPSYDLQAGIEEALA